MAQTNVRLDDELRRRIEEAADREGVTISSWVRSAVIEKLARRERDLEDEIDRLRKELKKK